MRSAGIGQDKWYHGVTRYQWIVLVVASLGWLFDIYESQIFVATMEEMMKDLLGPNSTQGEQDRAKYIANAAYLAGGALGGMIFGVLSDRIGRTRTMIITILLYSLSTCFSAFAQNWQQMSVLRFLVAMGVGGEWAVASAMVAEVMPGKARAWSLAIFHGSSAFGQLMAAAAGAFVAGHIGWRWVFGLSVAPALLTLWVRSSIHEPEQWVAARERARADQTKRTGSILDLFSPAWRRQTLVGVLLAAVGMATFWGVYIFGKNAARARGEIHAMQVEQVPADAKVEIKKTAFAKHQTSIKYWEMSGMAIVTVGGGMGLTLFGWIAERIGRRKAFAFYHIGACGMGLLLFGAMNWAPDWLLLLTLIPFGFLATGMHGGYAVYFPELFPTRLRGTGAGFCFNAGRILAVPILFKAGDMAKEIGAMQTAWLLSWVYLLGLVILLFAPETRGKELPQ